MKLSKIIWPMASLLILGMFTAALLPQHTAYGYGECNAPGNLNYAGVPGDRIHKVLLTWSEYDMSLCDTGSVTKAYDIEVRNSVDQLVREKTRMRHDKFSLPKSATKITDTNTTAVTVADLKEYLNQTGVDSAGNLTIYFGHPSDSELVN